MTQEVPTILRKWIVASPIEDNVIRLGNFELLELPIPELRDRQALVRTRLINLHSGTRSRMPKADRPEGRSLTGLGDTDLTNYGCAEVVASRDEALKVGDIVHWQLGWQNYQIVSSRDGPIGYAPPSPEVRALNRTSAPMNYVFRPEIAGSCSDDVLMHVFGTSGTTAWFGLRECGPLTAKDSVLVAAASGSVGALVAQIAKARGAQVVGLAGGEDRCAWVVETLGVDHCIDYRAPDLGERLRRAFPDGIDLFSDGVGGALTELVVPLINRNGRLFSYGSSASFYDAQPKSGKVSGMREAFGVTPEIEEQTRSKDIRIECWIVFDHYHDRLEAEDDLARMLRTGELKALTDVTYGFDELPQAVMDMYARPHAGKVQVDFNTNGEE